MNSQYLKVVRGESCINTELLLITPDHTGPCRKLAATVENQKVQSSSGTQLKTAFKPPPSVSGYKEHKAGYDYLQESDASCPPTLEPKVYPTKNQSKHRAPVQSL